MKTIKRVHYHKYFEENKKNCRALWIGINEIVYAKIKNKKKSPSSLIQDGKTITGQKHIAEYFNNISANCFSNAQFAFRLSLSTDNTLMLITENIQSQLDQNKFCAGVFVDLKKAFDTILLKKLSYYGIRRIANE